MSLAFLQEHQGYDFIESIESLAAEMVLKFLMKMSVSL